MAHAGAKSAASDRSTRSRRPIRIPAASPASGSGSAGRSASPAPSRSAARLRAGGPLTSFTTTRAGCRRPRCAGGTRRRVVRGRGLEAAVHLDGRPCGHRRERRQRGGDDDRSPPDSRSRRATCAPSFGVPTESTLAVHGPGPAGGDRGSLRRRRQDDHAQCHERGARTRWRSAARPGDARAGAKRFPMATPAGPRRGPRPADTDPRGSGSPDGRPDREPCRARDARGGRLTGRPSRGRGSWPASPAPPSSRPGGRPPRRMAASRAAMIFAAVTGPMPGRASSPAAVAVVQVHEGRRRPVFRRRCPPSARLRRRSGLVAARDVDLVAVLERRGQVQRPVRGVDVHPGRSRRPPRSHRRPVTPGRAGRPPAGRPRLRPQPPATPEGPGRSTACPLSTAPGLQAGGPRRSPRSPPVLAASAAPSRRRPRGPRRRSRAMAGRGRATRWTAARVPSCRGRATGRWRAPRWAAPRRGEAGLERLVLAGRSAPAGARPTGRTSWRNGSEAPLTRTYATRTASGDAVLVVRGDGRRRADHPARRDP